MKRFTRGYGAEVTTACGPSIKVIKADIAEMKEAIKAVLELKDGGYIHYEVQDSLLGNLYLRLRGLKEHLSRAKKQKKEK